MKATSISAILTLLAGAGLMSASQSKPSDQPAYMPAPRLLAQAEPNLPTPAPNPFAGNGDEKPEMGNVPWPPERLGWVRDDERSRWVHLTRCVGAPDTCTMTTARAPVGALWASDAGPNFIKLADGTWKEHRTGDPKPNLPDVDEQDQVIASATGMCTCGAGQCAFHPVAHAVQRIVTAPARIVAYASGPNIGGGSAGAYQTYYQPAWGSATGPNIGGGSVGAYQTYYQSAWGTQYATGPNIGGGSAGNAPRMGLFRRAPIRTAIAARRSALRARASQ